MANIIPFESERIEYSKEIVKQVKVFLNLKENTNRSNNIDSFIYDVMEEFILRGGKRLRAIMAITAYQGITGNFDIGPIYYASAAWEFMDVALLAQDDVIDQSLTRRGGQSCHIIMENKVKGILPNAQNQKGFGEGSAFIIGDIFLLWGMQMVNESDFPLVLKNQALMTYINASEIVAQGEMKDMFYGLDPENCTEEQYLKMIEQKTVHYVTQDQAIFGLILAKANEEQIRASIEYTNPLGMAFQIRDDLLDLLATDERFGKPIGNDIKEGKATIPVIYTLQKGSKSQIDILKKALGNRDASQIDIRNAIDVLVTSGGVNRANELLEYYRQKANDAIEILKKVGFHNRTIETYTQLNNWVHARTF